MRAQGSPSGGPEWQGKERATMEIGSYMDTHGVAIRSDTEFWLESIPPQDIQPVKYAQLAERVGFHSLWFPDHVTLPLQTTNVHIANPETGKRHYPTKPVLFDALATMAAVAVTTERIKLGTSVLISPYRPPLHDARQFATVDWLSNGRVIAGVGAGWAKEEFEALGLPYDRRGDMTDECIEIYKRAWTDDVVAFHGEFYNFDNLSMDPKPVQKPYPPIVFGGQSMVGARRSARLCDGFYPVFAHPNARPADNDRFLDAIRQEAERGKRDLSDFMLMGVTVARITDADDPDVKKDRRPNCVGTPEMILSDLQGYAEAGYSLMIVFQETRSRTSAELFERLEQFGNEIIPTAKGFKPGGEWMPVP